jgi:hypothetical protein
MPDAPITQSANLQTAPQSNPLKPPGPDDVDKEGRIVRAVAPPKPFDHELNTTAGKYYLVAIHESEIGKLRKGTPEKIEGWQLNIRYVEVATIP